MKNYVTQTSTLLNDSTMVFTVKPYSKLVDVNIANNMVYATFESPIDPMDSNKKFEIRLTNTFSVPPFDLSFYGTVKKSDVNIMVSSSGGSAQFSPELIETLYMVYYKEIKPAEEIRDERIEEVFE
jgi:hypothetical protein